MRQRIRQHRGEEYMDKDFILLSGDKILGGMKQQPSAFYEAVCELFSKDKGLKSKLIRERKNWDKKNSLIQCCKLP